MNEVTETPDPIAALRAKHEEVHGVCVEREAELDAAREAGADENTIGTLEQRLMFARGAVELDRMAAAEETRRQEEEAAISARMAVADAAMVVQP